MKSRPDEKHGDSQNGKRSPEYPVWNAMKGRCFRPRNSQFKNYGGRGITVCEAWRNSYVSFISDMGHRPSKYHSIERINNNGNYEPGNCRWATMKEQVLNRRTTRFIEINGERLTLNQLAQKSGIKRVTIVFRIDQMGWDPILATTLKPHEIWKLKRQS